MNTIGFDIGGTKTYIACSNDGTLQQIERVETPQNLTAWLSLFETSIGKYKGSGQIDGVGIGIAGAKQADGTMWVPNIPCLTGFDLETFFDERFGLKTFVENDAHMALVGELHKGAARDAKNVALLSIGSGIGGAFLIDGKIARGVHGAAGAFGWMTFGQPGTLEDGGKMLHYEEVASGNSLGNMARESTLFKNGIEMMAAYKHGDKDAERLFMQWVENLSYGIAAVASILDTERIILTGGITSELDLVLSTIKDKVFGFASPLNKNVSICISSLGDKACLYGALNLGQV